VSARALAAVARLVARAGLVEAFGHVSAREGDELLITPTSPLLAAGEHDVITLDRAGAVVAGDAAALPLEAPLHVAIYAARPDVGAICRTHSPHAAAWAARHAEPPLIHGLGLLAGRVALHGETDLVTTREAAVAAAEALGRADCLLLRANGAVAVGEDLRQAAVRACFLEQRARLADTAPGAAPLDESERSARSRHVPAETVRAWRWLALAHGDDELHDEPSISTAHPDGAGGSGARVSADDTPIERRDIA